MQMQLSLVLRKREGVVSRSLEDARLALRLDRSETLVFNGAANDLWDLFDGVHTVGEIAAETGFDPAQIAEFAGELVRLELFSELPAPQPGARRAVAIRRSGRKSAEAPQLVMREELAVMGGCTSSSVACNTPSSTLGNGNGQGNPPGPPNPPPGRNK